MTNLSSINFDLLNTYYKTYEIRSENQATGLVGYLLGWFILIFIPFMLSLNSGRLKFVLWFVSIFGAFLIFQIYARKVIFFNALLLLVFSFFYGRSGYVKRYLPHFFFLSIVTLPLVVDTLFDPLVDRFFYLVGVNATYYFDFFADNPIRYFEGTKLDFGISNYNMPVGYQIDNYYYQGYGVNQSAGFLPTIYSDLGLIGVIFGSFIVGSLLGMIKYIDFLNKKLSYLLMVVFTFSLMNHSLTMLFLSNGLIVVVFMCIFIRLLLYRTTFKESSNLILPKSSS
tara:strand:+ start:27597 stop:28445 length:849 start_codon:yes stop_codon:yes gene_type:complete